MKIDIDYWEQAALKAKAGMKQRHPTPDEVLELIRQNKTLKKNKEEYDRKVRDVFGIFYKCERCPRTYVQQEIVQYLETGEI